MLDCAGPVFCPRWSGPGTRGTEATLRGADDQIGLLAPADHHSPHPPLSMGSWRSS